MFILHFFISLCAVCVCCVCALSCDHAFMNHGTHAELKGQLLVASSLSPSIVWVPGTEVRVQGASSLPY